MLDLLHKHHFAEKAMVAASSDTVWWPGINGKIKSKYLNCPTCRHMKRANDPSTPVSQGATDVSIMDVLALDWMSIGALHHLIVVEKVTTYIWCRLFGQFVTTLQEKHIDHTSTAAYLAKTNEKLKNQSC